MGDMETNVDEISCFREKAVGIAVINVSEHLKVTSKKFLVSFS